MGGAATKTRKKVRLLANFDSPCYFSYLTEKVFEKIRLQIFSKAELTQESGITQKPLIRIFCLYGSNFRLPVLWLVLL